MNVQKLSLKKFTEVKGRGTRDISIRPNRSFGIPPLFYKEENLEQFSHADLYFDDNQKVIAFHFLSGDDATESVRLVKQKQGDRIYTVINAMAFMKIYKIEPESLEKKYPVTKTEIEGIGLVYCIALKKRAS